MAGFTGDDDEDVIANINVTPFVDIVLVLLIIFMVTASYIVQAQIKIDLPKAASGQAEVKTTLAFQVTKDGEYAVDGEMASLDQIAGRIKQEVQADPEVRAVIAADKGVEYGKVVDLMDTLKINGVQAIAFNIVRKEKPASP